jgi:hypothetical protein
MWQCGSEQAHGADRLVPWRKNEVMSKRGAVG